MHDGIILIIYIVIVASREGRKFLGATMEEVLKIENYGN